MENNGYSIDREATEQVFAKYGGPQSWLEAGQGYGVPEDEAACYRAICIAAFMALEKERMILEEEQEQVFRAIESGLEFGLNVLAYNFMKKQDKVSQGIYSHALDYVADNCRQYIDSTQNEVEDHEPEAEMPEEFSGYDPLRLNGYMHLVDECIDDLCPQLDCQNEFRVGALIAQNIFKAALDLAERVEKTRIDNEFEKIISDSDIDIEFEI